MNIKIKATISGIALLLFVATTATEAFSQVSIAKFKGNKKGALSLTFDDGLEEHYSIVYPELEKRSLKGTFAIVGRNVGGKNKYGPCVTWPQLKEMGISGHELSSHGWAHKNLTKLSLDEMQSEVECNDSAIKKETGFLPLTYVYPGNRTNDTVVEYTGRNRICTRTSQFSLGSKRTPEWFEDKIMSLIKNGEWGVSMTHGITYGYDAFGSVEAFTAMLDIACMQSDNLWIAPLAEIGAYVRERDNTTLDVKDNGKTLQITPKMSVSHELFRQPLTLLIDIDKFPGLISVSQDGTPLEVTKTADYFMVDISPSADTVICRYK